MSSHRASYQGSYRGFDRGTSTGRGRGAWRSAANLSRAESRQNLAPAKSLGATIDSINITTLLTEEDSPTIQRVEYVASYNWVSGKSPVILVPGQPIVLNRRSSNQFERLNSTLSRISQ